LSPSSVVDSGLRALVEKWCSVYKNKHACAQLLFVSFVGVICFGCLPRPTAGSSFTMPSPTVTTAVYHDGAVSLGSWALKWASVDHTASIGKNLSATDCPFLWSFVAFFRYHNLLINLDCIRFSLSHIISFELFYHI